MSDCCNDAPGSESAAFDLAVIGGGSAAFAATIRATELGARVLLVNEGTIGGTCVNIGCVPSKTLIRAAENHHWNGLSRFRGIKPERSTIDFGELMREKNELVQALREAKYENVLAGLSGVRLIEGRAKFVSPTEIEVGAERFQAGKIVIATGTRPALPAVPGLSDEAVWDSTRALEAPYLPKQLIVLGGSYIALELAQMFSRLGSQVTVLQRSGHVLSSEDEDVATELESHLRDEGVDIRVGQTLERIEREGEGFVVHSNGSGEPLRYRADAVIAALGRCANTDMLDLNTAGVALDEAGFVRVGEDLRTSCPSIFAAGDVIGDPAFVYTAAYDGGLAAENALSDGATKRDYTAIPWVVFTDPQVAGVGMSERQAASRGIEVDVSVLPLSHVPRALAARDTRGFIKLLRAKGEDRLLGARIVAPEGSEQIMEASLMIRYDLAVSGVSKQFHPYLTQGEGMKLAMLAFDKDVESLSCCAS